MNWLLAVVGALFGIAVAESRSLLGAVTGFFLAYLLGSVAQASRRIGALEKEIKVLRARAVASAAGRPGPSAVETAPEPSPSAPSPIPTADLAARPATTAAEAMAAASEPAASAAPTTAAGAAAQADAAGVAKPPAPAVSGSAPPSAPAGPAWEDRLVARVKAWFTEGNVQVKIGVIVIFFGVAAALKLAADRGYFHLPIELRLLAIAAAALVGLGLGWRERERRPAFGLSLQGGAIGVLLLVVFAGFRLFGLLPPMLAFGLIVALVAGAAALALLQSNMWLAVLGFLGGYLAPVLISTGSANHVALFSYYALLNAAVFAISWRRSWRLLNLVGFAFTFGVGTAWGLKFYRPELFASVEPFLVLYFLFYIAIGLLYVIRQTEHRRPWVDGTLVFGTPLLAFPLQAGMLKHDRMALAFSALAVALVYAGLVWWLRRRRDERLLTEAYGALALGFATLAIPLAFSAGTTASVWALEGAGVAWMGIRQNRRFPWLSGLALQLLAAGAYWLSLNPFGHHALEPPTLLLLNADWLGAAILAFSGFALSLVHDRHKRLPGLAAVLFAWAVFWWWLAGTGQLALADYSLGAWRFCALYLAVSIAGAGLLRQVLDWTRMHAWLLVGAALGVLLVLYAAGEFSGPLAWDTLPSWAVYFSALAWALWRGREERGLGLAGAHLCLLWSVLLAASLQLREYADQQDLADGWWFLALMAPLAGMTVGLWRRPALLAWPRAEAFAGYRAGWFAPAVPVMAIALLIGLFMEGRPAPLAYLPLLNPLELGWLAMAALLWGLARRAGGPWSALARAWPLLALVFASLATLRAVHHWHGEPWSANVLASGVSQASLTVVWSLFGVTGMLLGSRRGERAMRIGGWVLMVIVLAKLALVDRHYMGNVPGIVSCLVVGLLLVGVGYFSPPTPRAEEGGKA